MWERCCVGHGRTGRTFVPWWCAWMTESVIWFGYNMRSSSHREWCTVQIHFNNDDDACVLMFTALAPTCVKQCCVGHGLADGAFLSWWCVLKFEGAIRGWCSMRCVVKPQLDVLSKYTATAMRGVHLCPSVDFMERYHGGHPQTNRAYVCIGIIMYLN